MQCSWCVPSAHRCYVKYSTLLPYMKFILHPTISPNNDTSCIKFLHEITYIYHSTTSLFCYIVNLLNIWWETNLIVNVTDYNSIRFSIIILVNIKLTPRIVMYISVYDFYTCQAINRAFRKDVQPTGTQLPISGYRNQHTSCYHKRRQKKWDWSVLTHK